MLQRINAIPCATYRTEVIEIPLCVARTTQEKIAKSTTFFLRVNMIDGWR